MISLFKRSAIINAKIRLAGTAIIEYKTVAFTEIQKGLLVTAQQFYIVFQAYPGGFAYDVVIAKAVVAAQQHRKTGSRPAIPVSAGSSKAPAHKIHSCFCLHRFHFAHPFSPPVEKRAAVFIRQLSSHISMIIYHRSPEPGHLHLPRSN